MVAITYREFLVSVFGDALLADAFSRDYTNQNHPLGNEEDTEPLPTYTCDQGRCVMGVLIGNSWPMPQVGPSIDRIGRMLGKFDGDTYNPEWSYTGMPNAVAAVIHRNDGGGLQTQAERDAFLAETGEVTEWFAALVRERLRTQASARAGS